MAHTHTYVELKVSGSAYDEIAAKLRAADYGHVFGKDGEIDMVGIALTRDGTTAKPKVVATFCPRCNFPGPDWHGDR